MITPERYAEIRKIAGRDGQTWRSSAVSLVALNDVIDELDRLRAAVERLADKDQTHHHVYGNDRWVKVTDVLAALEGE